VIALWLAACGGASEAPPPAASPAAREEAPARQPIVVKPGEREARWAKARCNDGTPFAYTYRPGTSDTWVVHLSGGAFCDESRSMCSDRKPRLITTRPEADGAPATPVKSQGVLSPRPGVNPTFADAHHVDAHYCSSDLWLGTSEARQPNSADPDGWYFSGRLHVAALIEALPALHGLDPATDKVLLVGTSAGGAGLVGNLDQFAEAWPAMVGGGRMKAVVDGAWVADLPESSEPPRAERWGPLQKACADDLSSRGEDPGRCVIGPVWWPHVEPLSVPILVQISGADSFQTTVLGIDTPEELDSWRSTVHDTLQALPWVFSAAHRYHIVAIDPLFAKGPQGSQFRDLLHRFWAGEAPERWIRGYGQGSPSH